MGKNKAFTIVVLLSLSCLACEPFDLDKKNFMVCEKPFATIGYTVSQLEVTFFLDQVQGNIEATGWNMGDGRTRIGTRFTHIYNQAGTYTVSVVLANRCNDKYTTNVTINVTN